MDNVETLLNGTVEELDRLLNAKNVLGDPIEKGSATVIPIVSYGFGFGAGGGGNAKKKVTAQVLVPVAGSSRLGPLS